MKRGESIAVFLKVYPCVLYKLLKSLLAVTVTRSVVDEDEECQLSILLPNSSDFYKNHNPSDCVESVKMRTNMMRRNGGLQSAKDYAKLYTINPNSK